MYYTKYEKCALSTILPYDHRFQTYLFFFFLIGIHPMQGSTVTTRHGVTRKKAQKRLQDTENLLRKNLQLKDVC